ncbi:hypothetical protein [Corynebacterium qintianiae]|uniref:hypothetical protein n=1 Tax=Corynebacterium qintianiae TaxID=2709392 RepID=UPI0013EA4B0A|nr:hypothetical protein [Corynebacterium qintianiae]
MEINREAMKALINGGLVFSTVAHAVDYGTALPYNNPQPQPERFTVPNINSRLHVLRPKSWRLRVKAHHDRASQNKRPYLYYGACVVEKCFRQPNELSSALTKTG